MRLKGWVTDLLILISFLAVMIASGECEKDLVFFVKGIVCCIIFSFNSLILIKYGNKKMTSNKVM